MILRTKGIRGINKGVNAVAMRQITGWSSRIGISRVAEGQIRRVGGKEPGQKLNMGEKIAASTLGGALSCWNQPFEVPPSCSSAHLPCRSDHQLGASCRDAINEGRPSAAGQPDHGPNGETHSERLGHQRPFPRGCSSHWGGLVGHYMYGWTGGRGQRSHGQTCSCEVILGGPMFRLSFLLTLCEIKSERDDMRWLEGAVRKCMGWG